MQIPRRILLACVAATALFPLATFPTQDNEAQTKARRALDQAMKGLEGQPTVQPPGAASAFTNQSAQPQKQNDFPTQTAPVVISKPNTRESASRANAARLENALHQKMNENPGQVSSPAQPPVIPATPPAPESALTQSIPAVKPAIVPPAAPPAVVDTAPPSMVPPQVAQQLSQQMPPPAPAQNASPFVKLAEGPKFQDVVLTPGANPEDIEKAREALHQKMSGQAAQTDVPETTEPPKKAPAAEKKGRNKKKTAAKEKEQVEWTPAKEEKKPVVEQKPEVNKKKSTAETTEAKPQPEEKPKVVQAPSTFAPLSGPPTPLSASKAQRLQELLQQYKADKISAGNYHEQRAKILAEP